MDINSIEIYVQKNFSSSFKFINNKNKFIPFNKLSKPISECRVALISSGGLYPKNEQPFDTEEVLGDTTFRKIKKDFTLEDMKIAHTHYDHKHVREDLNCAFPLELLKEFEKDNIIGEIADTHYTFSGYILDTDALINNLAQQIASDLKEQMVDVVILAPV